MSFEKLDSHLVRSVAAEFCCLNRDGTAGIVKSDDTMELGINLLQNFQPFSSQIAEAKMDTGQPSSRMSETFHKSKRDRVVAGIENDRDVSRYLLHGFGNRSGEGVDQINFFPFKLPGGFLCTFQISLCVPNL